MNLTVLRSQFLELSNCVTKYVRTVYTLRGYKNILTANELVNTRINSYYCAFNLSKINKFSTTNVLPKNKDRLKDKNKVHVDVNELAQFIKLERMVSQLDEALENFKQNLIKYAAVRSNIGAIERLPITFENEEYTIQELVEISRKPNMIVLNVSAFPQIIPNILEVLAKSQMNLNPQQQGTTLYIPLPKVTKEYRENLVKNAKQYFVKCKNAISDIRNHYVKDLKKSQGTSEDLVFNGENYINAVQREYVDKAEQLLKTKQKELMGES